MSSQQWLQHDACLSRVQSARMAELAAETEEKMLEVRRINADNRRRAAAVAEAEQRTPPEKCGAADGASNASYAGGDGGDDDDGYDSEVLVPASSAVGHATGHDGGVAMSASRTTSLPPPPSSSSSGRDGLADSRLEGVEEPASALSLSGGGASSSTPVSTGDGTGASAVGAAGAGKRSLSAATAAGAPPKGGARAPVRFLEDLLTAPGQARRPKSRPRPETAAAAAAGNTGRKRSKKKRAAQREEPAPPSGPLPFSGLSVCVVHLGSVTSNTIKTFTKGVRSGGGQLSTDFTPGVTTHIVADASLASSWEKLDEYLSGWDADFMDDVADARRTAGGAGTQSGTFGGVPIMSSEWMSECLRRSAVAATGGYLLAPPPSRAPAAAAAGAAIPPAASVREPSAGGTAGKSNTGGGGAAVTSTTAAAGSAVAAAAAARKRKLASADEEAGGQTAASVRPPELKQARVEPVEGGHGARDPNVGEKRHKFFCQATSSGPQVRSAYRAVFGRVYMTRVILRKVRCRRQNITTTTLKCRCLSMNHDRGPLHRGPYLSC